MRELKKHLQESHKDLHQWFLMHQECLLLNYDEQAGIALEIFAETLHAHIHFENSYLLSSTQQLELRWLPTVYLKEHEKLLQMLGQLIERLKSYTQLQGRKKRLALLEVLDSEQTLLHVMEHHEEREEQDLFVQMLNIETEGVLPEWLTIEAELQGKHQVFKEQLKQLLNDDNDNSKNT